MATVGGSIVHGRGGITIGAPAVWSGDGELADALTLPPLARSTSSVASPVGTTSTTPVMMGLAATITPKSTGNLQITIAGDVNSTVIANGATIQVSHGTGTAPTNGAALAGTQDGIKINYIASTAAGKSPFSLTAYVTGLVAGTAYWIDLAVAAVTGGTATVADVNIVAIEV